MAHPFAGQHLPPPTETRGPMLLQTTWVLIGIATPFVVARVWARLKQMGKLGWDDYLMILSLVFGIITGALTTESVRWGFGQHIYYLTQEQLKHSIRLAYIIAPFGFMCLVFGRVSFAVSLIALIGNVKWRRWLLYFVIVSQFVINFILIGVGFGLCTPARKYWDHQTPGTCLDPKIHRHMGYAQGAFNIFADLVLAIMPALVISKLNLKRKIKIGLVILMSLGVFNTIAAAVTVAELTKVSKVVDLTYVFVISDIWGLIQAYLVIVIASIPFLRPLFTGTKAFSWSYYRSLLAKYSQRSRSTSGDDGGDSDDSIFEKRAKHIESLPHIPNDRFITTTIRNAGMETGCDRLSRLETGGEPPFKQ